MSVQKSSNLLDERSCAKEDRPIVHSLPTTDDYKNWTKVIFRSHNLYVFFRFVSTACPVLLE